MYAVFQLLLHILCLVSPLVLLTLGKRRPYNENETYVVDIEEGTADEVIEVLEKFYDLDYKDNLLTYFGGDWDSQIMPFDSLETDDAAEVLDTISRPESTFIVDLSGSKGYPVVGVPQMVGGDDPVWFDIMDRASIVSAIAKVKEMGD